MKRRSYATLLASLAVLVAGSAISAEKAEKEEDKQPITCPISNKPIDKEAAVDYKGGKLYFCCQNCPKAFAKSPEKWAAKANLQLVATKQFKQKACPISGQPCKAEHFAKISGVKVHFCCPNCKGKAEKTKKAEQVNLVFGDKPFKKAFEIAKKKEEKAAS